MSRREEVVKNVQMPKQLQKKPWPNIQTVKHTKYKQTNNKRSTLTCLSILSARLTLKEPLNTKQPSLNKRGQLGEEVSREVNRSAVAAHALVNHLSGLGDRTVLDSRNLAAVRIRHEADGESQHTLRSAVVGGTAGAGGAGRGSSVVEGHLAFAGGVLGAGAGGTGSELLQRSGDGGCAEGAEDGEGLEDGGHCDCFVGIKKEVIDNR